MGLLNAIFVLLLPVFSLAAIIPGCNGPQCNNQIGSQASTAGCIGSQCGRGYTTNYAFSQPGVTPCIGPQCSSFPFTVSSSLATAGAPTFYQPAAYSICSTQCSGIIPQGSTYGLSQINSIVPPTCQVYDIPASACCIGGSAYINTVPGNSFVDYSNCDTYLDSEEFFFSPDIGLAEAVPGQTYTMLKLDYDSPSKNITGPCSYVVKWAVANIDGSDLANGNVNGDEIYSYDSSPPEDNTLFHHYQVLIFQHYFPGSEVIYVPDNRDRFNILDFLYGNAQQGTFLCGPISGVQFRLSSQQFSLGNNNLE